MLFCWTKKNVGDRKKKEKLTFFTSRGLSLFHPKTSLLKKLLVFQLFSNIILISYLIIFLTAFSLSSNFLSFLFYWYHSKICISFAYNHKVYLKTVKQCFRFILWIEEASHERNNIFKFSLETCKLSWRLTKIKHRIEQLRTISVQDYLRGIHKWRHTILTQNHHHPPTPPIPPSVRLKLVF